MSSQKADGASPIPDGSKAYIMGSRGYNLLVGLVLCLGFVVAIAALSKVDYRWIFNQLPGKIGNNSYEETRMFYFIGQGILAFGGILGVGFIRVPFFALLSFVIGVFFSMLFVQMIPDHYVVQTVVRTLEGAVVSALSITAFAVLLPKAFDHKFWSVFLALLISGVTYFLFAAFSYSGFDVFDWALSGGGMIINAIVWGFACRRPLSVYNAVDSGTWFFGSIAKGLIKLVIPGKQNFSDYPGGAQ